MFPTIGGPEMIVVLLFAVLLFGKRLPEVGRSLGKGIVEFKKGVRGIEDEFQSVMNATSPTSLPTPRYDRPSPPSAESAVPKFQPPVASVPASASAATATSTNAASPMSPPVAAVASSELETGAAGGHFAD